MTRELVGFFEGEYRRYKALGERAIEQLSSEEVSDESLDGSSVATLVWHIAGNLESRFTDFLDSDGEKPWRDREAEFASRAPSLEDLRSRWNQGWGVLFDALAGLTDADLTRVVTIRGTALRADQALLRSLAHTSHHVGQIVYVAKALKGAEWEYLSIPPGGSADYNANPTSETGAAHAERLRRERSGR